jgi:hypothetical protein
VLQGKFAAESHSLESLNHSRVDQEEVDALQSLRHEARSQRAVADHRRLL